MILGPSEQADLERRFAAQQQEIEAARAQLVALQMQMASMQPSLAAGAGSTSPPNPFAQGGTFSGATQPSGITMEGMAAMVSSTVAQTMMALKQQEAGQQSERESRIRPKEPERFSGARSDDLSEWVAQMDNYLHLARIRDPELRLRASVQYLSGTAARQFRETPGGVITTYEELKIWLEEHFVVTDKHEKACLRLLQLAGQHHKLGIQEYNAEFQDHLTQACGKQGWGLPASWQILLYRMGLKDDKAGLEMKKAILSSRVTSVQEAMRTTVAVEGLLDKATPAKDPPPRRHEPREAPTAFPTSGMGIPTMTL